MRDAYGGGIHGLEHPALCIAGSCDQSFRRAITDTNEHRAPLALRQKADKTNIIHREACFTQGGLAQELSNRRCRPLLI